MFKGISDYNIKKLQRIQNTLARIVTDCSRYDHISPVLADLHWLPVPVRINYKLAMITFKTLSTGHPVYLSSLITPYVPARNLRSSDAFKLCIPPVTVAQTEFARRAFAYVAPQFWNTLPLHLRSYDRASQPTSFGRKLKTELFMTLNRC